MKKVFLSLAVIAALTVVSCKQADAKAEAETDSIPTTEVETPVVNQDSIDAVAKETAKADSIKAKATADSIAALKGKVK